MSKPSRAWPWTDLEVYESLHTGNTGDVAFYTDRCAGAGAVLELGCGGGRILLAVGGLVDEIVGLDLDPEPLAALAERVGPALADRVTLLQGDMRAFDLARRFDRVIVPFNTLYGLASDAEIVACLDCARRHLEPGGLVIFDGYLVPDDEADQGGLLDEVPSHLTTLIDPSGELALHVFEQAVHADGLRNIAVRYDLHLRDGGGAGELVDVRSTLQRHHYLTPGTLPRVVRRSGLVVHELLGSFKGDALGPLSDHMIVVAADRLRRSR